MSPTSATELREDAPVTLALDGAAFGIACRVVGFHRALIVLERATALPRERDRDALVPGIRSYVVCGDYDRPSALRVEIMQVTGSRVVLRLLDRFTLGQQRAFSRLEADWPITLDAGSGPVPARTVDVSAGGALVRSPVALRAGATVRVALELPGGGAPVRTAARVVRSGSDGAALRFVDMTTADEARVAEVVLEALGSGGVRTSRPLEDAVGEALAPT